MDRNREIKRVIQEVALRLLEYSGVTAKELAQIFESVIQKLESPLFSYEWLQDLDYSYCAKPQSKISIPRRIPQDSSYQRQLQGNR